MELFDEYTYVFTYTYDMRNMENLKNVIKDLMHSQSEMVKRSYLSREFRIDEHRLNRLFAGNDRIELPIFCLSILSHPYFVNPFNDPTHGQYALPGGQYTAQDLIDLIFDIIIQIISGDYSIDETAQNYSEVKSEYYRKMRSLGMSDDEINTFLSQCNIFLTQTIISCSIPENFPLLPFMNLWEPWSYPTNRQEYTIYNWSMQTFLLLIQLFKQDEGEAIDVHSFTCLEGIRQSDRTKNNFKMDYSWQYAYTDEEARSQDKRIGPECQRPYCPQTEDEINSKLIQLRKQEFVVDSESYSNEQNRHPKSRKIIYTKSDDGENIRINRPYIQPTGITVKCKDKVERTQQIYCKYDENAEEQLNYDESIRQLDESACLDEERTQVTTPPKLDESIDIGPAQTTPAQTTGVQTTPSACGVRFNFLGRLGMCTGLRC